MRQKKLKKDLCMFVSWTSVNRRRKMYVINMQNRSDLSIHKRQYGVCFIYYPPSWRRTSAGNGRRLRSNPYHVSGFRFLWNPIFLLLHRFQLVWVTQLKDLLTYRKVLLINLKGVKAVTIFFMYDKPSSLILFILNIFVFNFCRDNFVLLLIYGQKLFDNQ